MLSGQRMQSMSPGFQTSLACVTQSASQDLADVVRCVAAPLRLE
jgi:hypothetical protein